MFWPDLKFPPINLWSAPMQNIKYDFKGYAVDQDPTMKALRYDDMAAYMAKLKWLTDNPMQPVFISERSQ